MCLYTESLRRVLSDLRCGIAVVGAGWDGVEFSASPASRRKSTMSASAAFVLPTSDAVILPPRAPVMLFAPDMKSEVSSNEGLLCGME